MSEAYQAAWRESQTDPDAFWMAAADAIDWTVRPQQAFDQAEGWFPGASLNTCHNCIDRHVAAGRGEQTALIYDSPVTDAVQHWTYVELLDEVGTVASMLVRMGVSRGDRVVIYMPMVPEAIFAMLACARIGAIHSVVFGGFAAHELAKRIDDATPKLLMTASCGIEGMRIIPYKPIVDAAIAMAVHRVDNVVMLQRERSQVDLDPSRDYDWAVLRATVAAGPFPACVAMAADDPLYILYTSGTTGIPKGVVRDNGGHAVALKWTMSNMYDIKPGEVFWAASDVGWVVGHSYIVYAPLLHGATTVLFEGKPVGTPDAGTFWRTIARHKVSALFTAPTAFRAIKGQDPHAEFMKKCDLSSLRALFLAGERSDPDTLHWAEANLKVPVIDHWWQTETGWCIAGNPLGIELLPVKYGSATKALPGWDVRCVDVSNQEVKRGAIGAIVIKLPLPPGTLTTLWNADDRFVKSYMTDYPGYYQTSDAGFIDDDGYVYIMARTDDIINVAGHRLSTGAMEDVLSAHKDVAECAVIGVADQLKGQVPLGLLVLKNGVTRSPDDIVKDVVRMVRDEIGPVAAFKLAIVVDRLPKTRSGKILRGTMRKIADSEPYKMPATIDDPAVLSEISDALQTIGYAKPGMI